ncbi:MAG: DUF547 domain-containing protein [Planctomycetes bacterium]|nr:DUF547 domain-containing protein [Planctomycetota bacterium]
MATVEAMGDGSERDRRAGRGRRRWPRLVAAAVVLLGAAATLLALGRCRTIEVPDAARLGTYDTSAYADLLAGSVRDGLVDYAALRRDHADGLAAYLDAVGRFGPETSPELFPTEPDRLAYYLNAYNAIMLRRWLDADAGAPGRATPPTVNRAWFFLDSWRVDDDWVSLNALEQSIIRPTFDEPRVHFALVCGAVSCPPLLDEPFEGARLDEQLDGLGRRWLLEPDGLLVGDDGRVFVSRIFTWYAKDFEATGGLAGVLDRYLPRDDPRREAIDEVRAGRVEYLDYDWTINAP